MGKKMTEDVIQVIICANKSGKCDSISAAHQNLPKSTDTKNNNFKTSGGLTK